MRGLTGTRAAKRRQSLPPPRGQVRREGEREREPQRTRVLYCTEKGARPGMMPRHPGGRIRRGLSRRGRGKGAHGLRVIIARPSLHAHTHTHTGSQCTHTRTHAHIALHSLHNNQLVGPIGSLDDDDAALSFPLFSLVARHCASPFPIPQRARGQARCRCILRPIWRECIQRISLEIKLAELCKTASLFSTVSISDCASLSRDSGTLYTTSRGTAIIVLQVQVLAAAVRPSSAPLVDLETPLHNGRASSEAAGTSCETRRDQPRQAASIPGC